MFSSQREALKQKDYLKNIFSAYEYDMLLGLIHKNKISENITIPNILNYMFHEKVEFKNSMEFELENVNSVFATSLEGKYSTKIYLRSKSTVSDFLGYNKIGFGIHDLNTNTILFGGLEFNKINEAHNLAQLFLERFNMGKSKSQKFNCLKKENNNYRSIFLNCIFNKNFHFDEKPTILSYGMGMNLEFNSNPNFKIKGFYSNKITEKFQSFTKVSYKKLSMDRLNMDDQIFLQHTVDYSKNFILFLNHLFIL